MTRCLVRGSNATATNLGTIEINNCIISNCGSGGWAFLYPKFNVSNVVVKNTTMVRYNGGENFFRPQVSNTANVLTFDFENNTFFKISKANNGTTKYAICYPTNTQSTSSSYTFKNNIIAEPGQSGSNTLYLLYATGGNVVAQKNLIVDYGRFNLTTPAAVDTASNYVYYNYSVADLYKPAVGFQDTTSVNAPMAIAGTSMPFGNFHILSGSPLATASTTGGIIGDPRWLKSITTGVTTLLQGEESTIKAYVQAQQLFVSGIPADAVVEIYSFSGCLLRKEQVSAGSYSTSINQSCIIRVKANGVTKVLKAGA